MFNKIVDYFLRTARGTMPQHDNQRVSAPVKAPVFDRNQNSAPQSIYGKAHGSLLILSSG